MRLGSFRKIAARVSPLFLGTVARVHTPENAVALTFDDGPHPVFTPQLLKILAQHDARATFFMVGESASRFPEIVRQVAESGHAIGNHSWDHSSFLTISASERRRQLARCAQALSPFSTRLFRPPYGHQSIASRLDAFLMGYRVIAWSQHAYDWQINDEHVIARSIVENISPGNIILLHDAAYNAGPQVVEEKQPLLNAVQAFLTELSGGMKFVTVPELFRLGIPVMENWYRGQEEIRVGSGAKFDNQE